MEKDYCLYCMSPVDAEGVCPNCGLTSGSYFPAAHHLPPGTVLKERYVVGRVLGEGGFGITYIGCDMRLELRVAIKEYFPTDKANRVSSASLSVSSYFGALGDRYAEGKVRFLQEARTMARMDKQQVIVSVRDFFEANNSAYIVMEYIDGTTFKELVQQKGGRIPAGELLYIIEPLFYALSAMHERGLIHRDISPENLMLENGEIRLLDFGCAREAQNGDGTLTIALKHGYAPVEQYKNKGQGPWTDVYALSATIYYCLTGKRPPQSLDRLMEDELIPPRKLGVDLTERQEKALLYGMGIHPRHRFQSVQELHTALYEGVYAPVAEKKAREEIHRPVTEENAVPQEPDKPDTPEPKEETPEAGSDRSFAGWLRKNRLLCFGIAALLVAAVGLGVWLSVKNAPQPEPVIAVTAAPTATLKPKPTHVPTPEPTPEPFVNAVRLDENANEQVFRAFMASEQVEAVIVGKESAFDLVNGPLEVTKPLLIEEGASIDVYQPVTVKGEGFLRVEGEVYNRGLLRAMEGGSIAVTSTGALNGDAAVWIENERDLQLEDGAVCNMAGIDYGGERSAERFIVFNEEEAFANATHVASYAQYQEALNSEETKAIVIDGDMFLQGETHSVPVLISEGVTVSGVGHEWVVDGTLLVNRGTIKGMVRTGDWNDDGIDDICTVINYGTIDGGLNTNVHGAVINLGDVTIGDEQIRCGADVYNLGSMAICNWVDVLEGSFHNYGEIVADIETAQEKQPYTSKDIRLTLGNGARFFNAGVMRFGADASLQNCAVFHSVGELLFTDAASVLDNSGYMLLSHGAVLDMDEEAGCDYQEAVIHYTGDCTIKLPDAENNQLRLILDPGSQKGARCVSTESELAAALNDETCTAVILEGDISVSGDLTVAKEMMIQGSLRLTGGDLMLTDDARLLLGTLDMGGGTLHISDSAVLTGDGQCLNCGGITLQDQGLMLNVNRFEPIPGAEIELNGGALINVGGMRLEQVRFNQGGSFRSFGWTELVGCQVEINRNGTIYMSYAAFSMDETTQIVNRGYMRLHCSGGGAVEINGSIVNENDMVLDGNRVYLRGTVENSGTLQLAYEVELSGLMKNRGKIWLIGETALTVKEGGLWSGPEARTREDWIMIID